MAGLEKTDQGADPEKVAELSRNTTYANGDVGDPVFVHADLNDGDEAWVAPFHLLLFPGASAIPAWIHPPLIPFPFFPSLVLPLWFKWKY